MVPPVAAVVGTMIGDADGWVNAAADHALLIASPSGPAPSPRAPSRNFFVRPMAATGLSGFAVRRARFCDNIAKRAKV
jgi:hypothetical protein